jgi:hypothetical protein
MHDEIVSNAALAANIEALRWLKAEQDVKFYDKVPFNAYKHLHVLQYFVSEGCAVDAEKACYNAACCASLEVTKWAHTQGYAFPYDLIGIGTAMSGCLLGPRTGAVLVEMSRTCAGTQRTCRTCCS